MKRKLLAPILTALLLTTAGCTEVASEQSTDAQLETKVAAQQAQSLKTFPTFTARTINDSTVTDKIFADKKLTVLNIWGTFCPPCIAEMPELGRWVEEMPDDVQLIGLVCDVRSDNDTNTIGAAKKILREANANFINIIPSAEMIDYLSTVEAVPTTIFIDSAGNIVGEPIIGADVEAYKDFVERYLDEHGDDIDDDGDVDDDD